MSYLQRSQKFLWSITVLFSGF